MALIEIDLDDDALAALIRSSHRIEHLLESFMSAVQDEITALAARIDAGVDRVVAELADAKTPMDLSALSAAADKLDAASPIPVATEPDAPAA